MHFVVDFQGFPFYVCLIAWISWHATGCLGYCEFNWLCSDGSDGYNIANPYGGHSLLDWQSDILAGFPTDSF